jgi:hypothetical protein
MKTHPNNVKRNKGHIIDELKVNRAPMPSDDFFADFKDTVLEKIAQEQTAKIVPLYKRWYSWTAVAAAVALIFTVTWNSPTVTPSAKKEPIDFASLTREDVLEYMEEHIEDFEAEMLAEQMDSIPTWNVAETNTSTAVVSNRQQGKNDHLFDNLDKEDILKYLEEESIDLDEDLLLGS